MLLLIIGQVSHPVIVVVISTGNQAFMALCGESEARRGCLVRRKIGIGGYVLKRRPERRRSNVRFWSIADPLSIV